MPHGLTPHAPCLTIAITNAPRPRRPISRHRQRNRRAASRRARERSAYAVRRGSGRGVARSGGGDCARDASRRRASAALDRDARAARAQRRRRISARRVRCRTPIGHAHRNARAVDRANIKPQLIAGFYDMTGVQLAFIESLGEKVAAVYVPSAEAFAQPFIESLSEKKLSPQSSVLTPQSVLSPQSVLGPW